MAFRWQVKAVAAQDAIETGTGLWEPFAYDQEAGNIFVKQFIETDAELPTMDNSKRSEVSGGLGGQW